MKTSQASLPAPGKATPLQGSVWVLNFLGIVPFASKFLAAISPLWVRGDKCSQIQNEREKQTMSDTKKPKQLNMPKTVSTRTGVLGGSRPAVTQ